MGHPSILNNSWMIRGPSQDSRNIHNWASGGVLPLVPRTLWPCRGLLDLVGWVGSWPVDSLLGRQCRDSRETESSIGWYTTNDRRPKTNWVWSDLRDTPVVDVDRKRVHRMNHESCYGPRIFYDLFIDNLLVLTSLLSTVGLTSESFTRDWVDLVGTHPPVEDSPTSRPRPTRQSTPEPELLSRQDCC